MFLITLVKVYMLESEVWEYGWVCLSTVVFPGLRYSTSKLQRSQLASLVTMTSTEQVLNANLPARHIQHSSEATIRGYLKQAFRNSTVPQIPQLQFVCATITGYVLFVLSHRNQRSLHRQLVVIILAWKSSVNIKKWHKYTKKKNSPKLETYFACPTGLRSSWLAVGILSRCFPAASLFALISQSKGKEKQSKIYLSI